MTTSTWLPLMLINSLRTSNPARANRFRIAVEIVPGLPGASPVTRNSHAASRSSGRVPVIHAIGTTTSFPPVTSTRRISLNVCGSKIYSEGKVATTVSKTFFGNGRCCA